RLNIGQATLLAMRRALARLRLVPAMALVDGNRAPDLPCPVRTVVGGDGLSLSIAAASIIAKVVRDRAMTRLSRRHDAYGWERNAGYGTAAHLSALRSIGLTRHHRRGFAPVRDQLALFAMEAAS
ncbi:ribonuclease HII, partial [Acidomonas methanolica]